MISVSKAQALPIFPSMRSYVTDCDGHYKLMQACIENAAENHEYLDLSFTLENKAFPWIYNAIQLLIP